MIIEIARHAGFCGGVKRAVQLCEQALENGPAACVGDIIHNSDEVKRLRQKGLLPYTKDLEKIQVIIRSHGLPKSEKDDIIKHGHKLIDGTCPVLLKIYEKIRRKEQEGYRIVIIGDPEHPEIVAMAGHLAHRPFICPTDEAAQAVRAERLYVISQTTNPDEKFQRLSAIIKGNNTFVVVENTICNATKLRQSAAVQLAQQTDAMIVIGGYHSANTNKLYELCKTLNPNTFRIENCKDLPLQEVLKYKKIGLTAGASTPDRIIEEVVNVVENYSKEEFMEHVEESMNKVYPKEIVKGNVIYVTDDEVMVNIGYKSDGIIKRDELTSDETKSPRDLFKEGDEIDVYIIKLDDGEGNVVLSTRRVEAQKAWKKLVEAYENNETVMAKVLKEVKGGLVADVEGINAFIPGSHVTDHFVKNLEQFVGQTLECRIINIDERKRRLVISRKELVVEEKERQLDEAWKNIEVDKVVKGVVQRLTDFGAFVDIGGVDGLVHISDISWNRLKHPSEELKEGQEVDVKIMRANREKNRISLGMKQLKPRPFEEFVANNAVGDIVQGVVMSLVEFGAFVRLKEGVEGLVHISQISHEHIEKPSDELNAGDVVDVKILEIVPEERRIALSIKQTKEAPAKPERKPREKKVSDRPAKKRKPRQEEVRVDMFNDDEALNSDLGFLLGEMDLELAPVTETEEAPQAEEEQQENTAQEAADSEEKAEAEDTADAE